MVRVMHAFIVGRRIRKVLGVQRSLGFMGFMERTDKKHSPNYTLVSYGLLCSKYFPGNALVPTRGAISNGLAVWHLVYGVWCL